MELKQLTTVDEIVDVLGGSGAASRLAGCKSFPATNWRKRGMFPADTYAVINDALAEKGFEAPRSLFRQRERVPSLTDLDTRGTDAP